MARLLLHRLSLPWQASAALGWTTLAAAPYAAEVWDRQTPQAAAEATAAGTEEATMAASSAVASRAVAQLQEDGFAVIEGALCKEMLMAANKECNTVLAFSDTEQHDAQVRSDQVTWVSSSSSGGSDGSSGLGAVLSVVRGMALALQCAGFAGFHSPSGAGTVHLGVPRNGQVARYVADRTKAEPPSASASDEEIASARVVRATGGARYAAHRDGLPLGSAGLMSMLVIPGIVMRELTVIFYLTDPATELAPATKGGGGGGGGGGGADGCAAACYRVVDDRSTLQPGALVLYLGADEADTVGGTAQTVVEILPVGGRAVLFDSRRILHEVVPVTRPDLERLAMTVWIGGPATVGGAVSHLRAWLRARCDAVFRT